jgi:hypothetical protein
MVLLGLSGLASPTPVRHRGRSAEPPALRALSAAANARQRHEPPQSGSDRWAHRRWDAPVSGRGIRNDAADLIEGHHVASIAAASTDLANRSSKLVWIGGASTSERLLRWSGTSPLGDDRGESFRLEASHGCIRQGSRATAANRAFRPGEIRKGCQRGRGVQREARARSVGTMAYP